MPDQALTLEAGFGNIATIIKARRRAKLPKPAFVFPQGRCDEYAFGGVFCRHLLRLLAFEWHDGRLPALMSFDEAHGAEKKRVGHGD